MSTGLESQGHTPSCRDYVIKDGVFIGKFEEMYRDVPDPWGCVAKANTLSNRLLLSLLEEFAFCGGVLDVGCGLGALTALVRQVTRAQKVVAFDLSPTAVEKAKKAVPGVEFFPHDLVKSPRLPFPEGTFSLIMMAEVVWYILPVLGKVCDEFRRLLFPSGRLMIKQTFLPPGQQKYGNDVVSKPEDLFRFIEQAGLFIERKILLSESNGDQIVVFSAQPQS